MTNDQQSQLKRSIQLFLGLGLTCLFFYMMGPLLVPIVLGGVIAIVVYPIFERRRRLPRPLSAFIVTMGIVVGVLLPIFLMLYGGAHRLLLLFSKVRSPQTGTFETLQNHPVVTKTLAMMSRFTPVNQEWIQSQGRDIIQNVIEKLTQVMTAFIGGIPGLLLAIVIVILSVYFFLVDGARFLRFLSNISPLDGSRSRDLYGSFEKSCRGVVLGLFASSAVQAILMCVFFSIAGISDPLFIAGLTFVMGMVPVVGSAPLWIGATIYLFVNGRLGMGIMMLVGGILISTSDNIVRPLVMKGHSEMHPLLALVSVFGAVNLIGPTGIFLGPVIAAVFVSFLRIFASEMKTGGST